MTLSRTVAARLALIGGGATIMLSLWFFHLPPIGCGTDQLPASQALMQFQMTRTMAALAPQLGCTASITAFDRMNTVDLYGYIWAYALFMGFALFALTQGWLQRTGFALLAAAVLGDVVETATQLAMGRAWPGVTLTQLRLLAFGSSLKFAALALLTIALGAGMASGGLAWALLGAGVAAGGLVSLGIFIGSPLATPALALGWFGILVACGFAARPERS